MELQTCRLEVADFIATVTGATGIFDTGDELDVDLAAGRVSNVRTGAALSFRPWCESMLQVWRLGGLAPALRQRVAAADATLQ